MLLIRAMSATHRDTIMGVLRASLTSHPYTATLIALAGDPQAQEALSSVAPDGNIFVVGAGKAGAPMSRAVESALSDRITAGLVIVKDGHTSTGTAPLQLIELREASHPVPDDRAVTATDDLLRLVQSAGEGDLVICLISGGGSALLTQPAEGISLSDVQATTDLLLKSGASINELNAVRKHLSSVSGGQLARAAAPAGVLSFILSDVVGSPLDVIASGPTVPDPTSYSYALNLLTRYNLTKSVPPTVVSRLRAGLSGLLSETPKPGDPIFKSVKNILVASNVQAVEAAAEAAREQGLNTMIVSTYLEGEAREVGRMLAGLAHEILQYSRPVSRPACLLFGGETTVTVRGTGIGGRNSELALSAAIHLRGLGPRVFVASLATDGGDGPSPGAGAIVDGTTVDRGVKLGLDAQASLSNNDSYTYLSSINDALITGPTGTNVNDIMAVFVF
jgi:glycerate 2-kinase